MSRDSSAHRLVMLSTSSRSDCLNPLDVIRWVILDAFRSDRGCRGCSRESRVHSHHRRDRMSMTSLNSVHARGDSPLPLGKGADTALAQPNRASTASKLLSAASLSASSPRWPRRPVRPALDIEGELPEALQQARAASSKKPRVLSLRSSWAERSTVSLPSPLS